MRAVGCVVVADDDPGILKLFRDLLSKEGHEVALCPDGQAAIEAVWEREPELLILDLGMPRKSGLDVIRELRAKRNLVPILLVSGAEDHPAIPPALAHSGVAFLAKPFRLAECRRAVARAVAAR